MNKCTIIAEVAQSHDGSLGLAHAFIDAAAKAGADAIKFQTHIAAAESTPGEPWRIKFSRQDKTRYEYWKRMEFGRDAWFGLKAHAAECGLSFLSSPFSVEAVELLTEVGVAAWKIPSGEIANYELLGALAPSKLPVLLSTGMSSLEEVSRTVEWLRARDLDVTLFQCTSAYPCPPERVGLNVLQEYRERYRCGVGLSDHSGTIYPGLAAAALGANFVEVHLTLSPHMFGPDVSSSLTVEQLTTLAQGVRYTEQMLGNPVDKDELARDLEPMRRLFTKSVASLTDLTPGTVVGRAQLGARKPGTGIAAVRLDEFVGKRVKRFIPAHTLVAEEDFE